MLKLFTTLAAIMTLAAPAALAQNQNDDRDRLRPPAERLGTLDRRLDIAERNGAWEQGTRADHIEDRFDRFEDRVDRRESRRDEAVDFGRRDVIEDRLDRAESRRDRAENVVDRRRG